MDDRPFGARIEQVPDEVRVRMHGDLDSRADAALGSAYQRSPRSDRDA